MDQKQILTKIESKQRFSKLYSNIDNSSCFYCGRQCKQWVETRHAIFLCLTCAALFREIPRVVNIKSVTLDLWTQSQMRLLERGGNAKFKEFIRGYDMSEASPEIILRSNAAEFYRLYLLNPQQLKLSDAPAFQYAGLLHPPQTPLKELSANEILHQAKAKLTHAGETTLYYSSKAYQAIQNKISTGQYKQDVQKAAQKVTETAKNIWNFVSHKIEQLQNNQSQAINV